MFYAIIIADVPLWAFTLGGGVLAAVCLLFSLRAGARGRLIDNLPTSKTAGVFIGLVEIKGTAESERPLGSYLAEIPCVYYNWSVQEKWSRTVTETYTDSDGKTKTRTRHESGWKTVASGGDEQLFYLQDDCGVIRVNPTRAKIRGNCVFSQRVSRGDSLYYDKGPGTSVMDSDHIRRFTEQAIPLHHQLYIIGHASERNDMVAAEIAHDDTAPMYLISTQSEKQISFGYKLQLWILGVLALILAVAGQVIADAQGSIDPGSRIGHYLIVGASVGGAWALGWVWMVYNSMADLKNRVRQGWSNVDVQLKRRHDLIPQLVRVVEGLADHERTVHQEVALLRSQTAATEPGSPGPDPQGCAKSLIAIREAYPQLKTNKAFLRLQAQLVETEQRIALARTYFNEIAAHYNTRLQVIPDRFVAAMGSMKAQAYITAENFERAEVRVSLAR
ncbi:MAG: LemA family protein [Phycisphaerae bacterium]|jgi:hypothetical protein|nr:LemA family protein [Phycisphaerae bacterium]